MFSEEAMIALDGGRAFNGGNPPAELHFGDASIPNPRKDAPPQTILGADQKAWFKDSLRKSTATWKIWGNSLGALGIRVDPQNLPAGLIKKSWPDDTYAILADRRLWRRLCRARGRSTISSAMRRSPASRSSPATGTASGRAMRPRELPPRKFEPVGLSFVGASLVKPRRHGSLRASVPRRPIRSARSTSPTGPDAAKPDWTYNMLLNHGVRSCLEYAKSFDLGPRASALEPGACAAPRVRRSGRPRLCDGSPDGQ